MDRLKDEYYDENEDFSEINKLLDLWSRQEAETPKDLHQKIMSVLPAENKNAKGVKRYYRYLATAALAAVVILASVSLSQMGALESDNTAEADKMRTNEAMLFKQADAEKMAEENTYNEISDTASAQSVNMAAFSADGAIDWQKEKEEKEALLKEQEELLQENKGEIDAEKPAEIIAWLQECLSVIEQQDSEKYEELLKNSPLSE